MSATVTNFRTPPAVPELRNGDHLSRDEFERRYHAMPEVKKAELIEGVVHMPSPVRQAEHSGPHFDLIGFLWLYRAYTPGVVGGDNGTVRLDMDNEPQPDAYLYIDSTCGGRARIDSDGYVTSSPELVAEIAASSASYDLHTKLTVYRRNQVREYIVWRVLDRAVDWFVLRGSQYEKLAADGGGVIRSEVFPGLWLNVQALLAADLQRIIATSKDGLDSPEHRAFRARLTAAADKTPRPPSA